MAKLKPAPADKGPTRVCPDCGTKNHVKRPKCKNEGCDHVFPKPEGKVGKSSGKAKAKGEAIDREKLAYEHIVLTESTLDKTLSDVVAYTDPVIPPVGVFINSLGGKAEAVKLLESLKAKADSLKAKP